MIRALINVFMKLDIRVEVVKTEKGLEEGIIDAISRC